MFPKRLLALFLAVLSLLESVVQLVQYSHRGKLSIPIEESILLEKLLPTTSQNRRQRTDAGLNNTTELDHQRPPEDRPAFCYAFLLGGVHESNPGYRGFLYNIMIAAEILRERGSKADVLLMVQYAYNSTWEKIPEDTALHEMNIQLLYLPKPDHPLSFADLQLQKFRVLQLTQYSRVLFMDGDIMPLQSMDYLFELSMQGVLKENLVVATRGEPSNGGYWMVKPGGRSDLEELQDIVKERADPFDRAVGWGHNFAKAGDHWEATMPVKRPRWKFWAAHLDQGLLYYWVKYHKKNVSLVIGERIQNWDHNENGDLVMESEQIRLLDNYTKPMKEYWTSAPPKNMVFLREAPYRDYVHFTGKTKPWLGRLPRNRNSEKPYEKRSEQHLWFHKFRQLNDRLGLGYDVDNWTTERAKLAKPPVGLSDGNNVNQGRFTTYKLFEV